MNLSLNLGRSCRTALKLLILGLLLVPLLGVASTPVVRAQQAKGSGYVEVCKDWEPGVSGDFHFTVDSAPGDHVVAPGTCTPPIGVSAGQITITETQLPDDLTLVGARTDPASALAGSDWVNSTVSVNVPSDGTEVAVWVENVPAGWFELCKDADQWISGTFTVGYQSREYPSAQGQVDVPVGACTAPMKVPAGNVDLHETAQPGTILTDVKVGPPNDGGTSVSHVDGSFSIHVARGDASTEVVATIWNNSTAELKLCKVYGVGVDENTPFWFTVTLDGWSWHDSIPAGPASSGGFCKLIPVPVNTLAGSTVRIAEQPPALPPNGQWFLGVDQDGNALPPDSGAVNVSLHPGLNVVTFTDEIKTPIQIKVCKAAGDAATIGQTFTFDLKSDQGATATVAVQAGPSAQGGFCTFVEPKDGNTFYVGDAVTVTERSAAGTQVSAIDVLPSDVAIQNQSLASRSVTFIAGTGLNTVTFTDRSGGGAAAAPAPPAASPDTGDQTTP